MTKQAWDWTSFVSPNKPHDDTTQSVAMTDDFMSMVVIIGPETPMYHRVACTGDDTYCMYIHSSTATNSTFTGNYGSPLRFLKLEINQLMQLTVN